jgi:hypothetical protein
LISPLKINYHPNPGQAAFHSSPALYKWYCGALGAGKSTTIVVESIFLSIEYPGNVGLIARDTLPQLRTTTQAAFFNILPSELLLDYNKLERKVLVRSSGKEPSTIYFHPLDDPERYKSLNLGFFAIDEGDCLQEEMFNILIGRLRHPLPNIRYSGMIASNPTTTHHWLYKKFFEATDPDYALFRAKTHDNVENLPVGYIERLRKSYAPDWQKRYLEGEPGIVQTGSPVFTPFRVETHVRPVTHKQGRLINRGWDFGFHSPVCVWTEFDELGRFLVLDSLLGHDEDLHKFADRVIQKSNADYPMAKFKDYCDPAGVFKKDTGKSSIQVLNDKRIYPTYRFSKPEERAAEIRRLMEKLIQGEPAFQIHPRNIFGIECLIGGYQYDKNKDGTLRHDPKKDDIHDHFPDATGYIVANTTMMHNENDGLGDDFDIAEASYCKPRVRGARNARRQGY